jgi:hypothetical protein
MASFYIASKFENKAAVAALAAALESMGHTISHKWYEVETAYMEDAPKHAREDFEGVRKCDIFAAIFVENFAYLNVYVELGAALAFGKLVCIIGHADDKCLFTRLEDAKIMRFSNTAVFMTWVMASAARRG